MFADLDARERKVFCQNGEDGVIEALFEELGTTNKYFVEFGCEDAIECNTANLLEQGWTGLLMDYYGISNNPLADVKQALVNAENVNALFRHYGVPDQFDLLSIDVDGNDFWIWREIVARPRVVIIEYNAAIPPDQCLSIVYDPGFAWSGSDYFGASLLALAELGRRKGYSLVYCERAGVNAFFVADEALPPTYQPRPIAEIYRPPNYHYLGKRHPHDRRPMINPFLPANDLHFNVDAGWTGM